MVENNQSRFPGRAVLVGAFVFVVFAASVLGALDELPVIVRAGLQALGTVGGIFCGYWLQLRISDLKAEGAVRSAVSGLLGTTQTVQGMIENMASQRAKLSNHAHQHKYSIQTHAEAVLEAEEAYLKTLLPQMQAAVDAWRAVDPKIVEAQLTRAQQSGGGTPRTPAEETRKINDA